LAGSASLSDVIQNSAVVLKINNVAIANIEASPADDGSTACYR
jgi:hypothetical protein